MIADYPAFRYYADNRKLEQKMVTITAAQFQKQFGRYRDLALKEPVAVTHHGRESLVIVAADEFRRLKAMDTRKAYYAWEMPDDLVEALEKSEPPASSAEFNHELES